MTEARQKDEFNMVRFAKGKRPEIYDQPGMNHVMSMVLTLASEINVLHDRLDAHERVAKAKGIDLAQEIEAYEMKQEDLEERQAWREGFLDRLYYVALKEVEEMDEKETKKGYHKTIADIAVS